MAIAEVPPQFMGRSKQLRRDRSLDEELLTAVSEYHRRISREPAPLSALHR